MIENKSRNDIAPNWVSRISEEAMALAQTHHTTHRIIAKRDEQPAQSRLKLNWHKTHRAKGSGFTIHAKKYITSRQSHLFYIWYMSYPKFGSLEDKINKEELLLKSLIGQCHA